MKLCVKHDYRKLSEAVPPIPSIRPPPNPVHMAQSFPGTSAVAPYAPGTSKSFDSGSAWRCVKKPKMKSYKAHFKQRYLVETAWRTGGQNVSRHIAQDQGVVTSLHLTPKYIVVALDNAKIHVFNTDGNAQKTLIGHVMGVWAMVPWGDTLVSGGCDRDVRVWDMATGYV